MSYSMYNQGLKNTEKPTSRVLRPPGGGNSFSIFGDVEEPSPKKKQAPTSPAAASPKATSTRPQIVARTPDPSPSQPAATATNKDNNATGKSDPSVHTTTRIHNPPGGKSNIFFG